MLSGKASRLVVMGTVGSPHGIRGWVKINAATTAPEGLIEHSVWLLQFPDGRSSEYRLEDSRMQNERLVAKFEGVDTRDDAELIVGSEIQVRRSALKPLEQDIHYWCDLIGMEVRNAEGRDYGRVKNMMRLPANDVLVVEGNGKEMLIPFLKRYVLRVEEAKHTLVVDWEENY